MNTIFILRDRRRGGRACVVKYMRLDKYGGELHRTLDCATPEEAEAQAIDVNHRLFHGAAKIIGLINRGRAASEH